MKSTALFKEAIQTYLEQCATFDELFAEKYKNGNKNLDDCIQYILHTVQKSGINGFADNEVFAMAIEYYQQDTIDIGRKMDCKVIINRMVELTEEEKAQIKQDAIQKIHNETYTQMKQPSKKAVRVQLNPISQPSLFD